MVFIDGHNGGVAAARWIKAKAKAVFEHYEQTVLQFDVMADGFAAAADEPETEELSSAVVR